MILITARFQEYLQGLGISKNTLKNYKSDMFEFENFIVHKLKALEKDVSNLNEALPHLSILVAEEYKKHLTEKEGSPKTVNRSLSTLRKFSKYVSELGYTSTDFASGLSNIIVSHPYTEEPNALIRAYEANLVEKRFSRNTIKNYLSDIRHFLNSFKNVDFSTISFIEIKKYFLTDLKHSPLSSSDRKLSSLKNFFEWLKENKKVQDNPISDYAKEREMLFPKVIKNDEKIEAKSNIRARIIALFAGNKGAQKTLHNLFYTRPEWYKRYQISTIAKLFNLGLIVALAVSLGIGTYEQFFAKTEIPLAYPTSLRTPKRYLSFQGRLLDEFSTPVTEVKSVIFKLYNTSTSGTAIWTGTCNIDPDEDGIFSTLLGSDCGTEIDSSVFSDNSQVWLGIAIDGDTEASPRVQIATVGYALNAETVQGYPITATRSAIRNSIVTMNNDGWIVIGETGPKMTSVSGTFAIEGQALTLQTAAGTGGDINIAPDTTGSVNITSSTLSDDTVYITNAQQTTGALLHAYYGGTGTTVNLLSLGAGDPETDKFWVRSDGTTYVAGNLGIGTTSPTQELDINGDMRLSGALYDSQNSYGTAGYVLTSGGAGIGTTWVQLSSLPLGDSSTLDTFDSTAFLRSDTTDSFTSGVLGLGTGTTLDINSGSILDVNGNLTISDTDIALDGASTNLTSTGNFSINTDDLFITQSTGNVGIGITNPGDELDVVGEIDTSTYYKLGDIKILDVENTGTLLIGQNAAPSIIAGADYSTIIGQDAGYSINSANADYNTLIGSRAGYNITSGSLNTAIGDRAMYGSGAIDGSYNTVIGAWAGEDMVSGANSNVLIGEESGSNLTTGDYNTYLGSLSGQGKQGTNTGSENTAMGYGSLKSVTTALGNIAIGKDTATTLETGVYNVVIGYSAGVDAADINGSITIGAGAWAKASNQLVIGSSVSEITDAYFGEGVTSATKGDITFNATGGSGTNNAGANFILSGGKATGNADSGDIIFKTGTVGASSAVPQTLTERVRLLDEGYLGIGTSAPGNLLQIGTPGTTAGTLSLAGGTSGLITIDTLTATETWSLTLPGDDGDANEVLITDGSGNTSWEPVSSIGIGGTGTANYITKWADVETLTNSVIFDNGTNVGIGTTSPGTKLGIVGGVGIGTTDSFANATVAANDLAVQGNIGIGTTSPQRSLETTGSIRMGALITGAGSAVAVYRDANGDLADSTSSIKYKYDITGFEDTLSKINDLNIVRFKWKDNTSTPNQSDYGLIAEEVNNLLPELVTYESNGFTPRGLKYEKMGVFALKGIQEQQEQISDIKNSLVNLSGVNLTSDGEINIEKIADTEYKIKNVNTGNTIDQIAAFGKLFTGNVSSGYSITKELLVENTGIILGTLKAGAIEAGNITTNGFITVQGTVDNILVKVGLQSPSVQTAMISPLVNEEDIAIKIGNSDSSRFGKLMITNAGGVEVVSIDEMGNATFSGSLSADETISDDIVAGTIYADQIISRNGTFEDLSVTSLSGVTRDEVEAMLKEAEIDQKVMLEAMDWNTGTASGSANIAASIISTTDLFVTNQAAVNALSVSSSITIGIDMVIASLTDSLGNLSNSINSLTAPLSIQSLALAPVEIMAGKFKINTSGDVEILGNLFVAGRVESKGITLKENSDTPETKLFSLQDKAGSEVASINASGSATLSEVSLDSLVIATSDIATQSANTLGVIESNATAGHAVLGANMDEITINNAKITENTLVYITPTTSTQNNVLYVKAKGVKPTDSGSVGYFKVGFNKALDTDTEFNWWIVEIKLK